MTGPKGGQGRGNEELTSQVWCSGWPCVSHGTDGPAFALAVVVAMVATACARVVVHVNAKSVEEYSRKKGEGRWQTKLPSLTKRAPFPFVAPLDQRTCRLWGPTNPFPF